MQFPADLVTFTEEILTGKLHFLCSHDAVYEEKQVEHQPFFFETINSLNFSFLYVNKFVIE